MGSLGICKKISSYAFFKKVGGIFQSVKSKMAAIGHGEKQELISSTGLQVEHIFEYIYIGNKFIEIIVVVFTIL